MNLENEDGFLLNSNGIDMMRNILIIMGVKMKRFLLIIYIASLLFAIEPVPRTKKTGDDKASKTKTEIVTDIAKKQVLHKSTSKRDSIIDVDSNSVNDQREHDLQQIKWLKSKFKDLFKKNKSENAAESRDEQDRTKKNKRK